MVNHHGRLCRAGYLMQLLEKEAVEKAKTRFEPPRLLAGDAVEVKVRTGTRM